MSRGDARGASAHKLRSTRVRNEVGTWRDRVTTRTTAPRGVGARKGPRVLAALGLAAMLALSGTIISGSPIGTQAAGSIAVVSGSAWAWGDNGFGQLGNGTTTNSSTPVAVSLPAGTTVTAIAGGGFHSLALTSSGQVLAWGYNFNGQLGNGTTADSSIPVAVSLPSGTTVTAIAGGGQHSLALTSAGQVLAWGYNSDGELGNGTTTNSSTPVAVSLPSGTTVTAIAGGGQHSLALTSSGQVLAWGYNGEGELGNGTTTSQSNTPVAVSLPSGTTVTAIAGGFSHSLALTSTGQVLAWGRNLEGELGNGTTTTTGCWCISYPVVVSAIRAAVAISGGGYHSLAIQLPSVAVFPAMANGAYGGYVTAATIQNTGTAPASVRIAYFDQNGAPVGTGDAINNLPVNASWTVRQDNGNSFPSSGGDAAQAGSAVVYSSQPIAAFVNEFAPGNVGDATSYSGIQVPGGVGTTLYAPAIVNNAYGGYSAGIGQLKQGSSPTDVIITYRDGSGVVVK